MDLLFRVLLAVTARSDRLLNALRTAFSLPHRRFISPHVECEMLIVK
jgi:hypothetical protein